MSNIFIPKSPVSSYPDYMSRIFPEFKKYKHIAKTITLQVTDDCCMACTYCYQHHKQHHIMSFETAKKCIDYILDLNNPYINPSLSPAIIIDFIGGEPLMAVDLIQEIIDYFTQQCVELNHPWLFKHRFSICSNGLLYFEPKVQQLLEKYGNRISFTISIDGNKELHDSCRVDLDNCGTYDRAIAAVHHYREHYNHNLDTKMTLSPDNINFTYQALKSLIEEGYSDIHLNCIFEEGWEIKHGMVLYQELKSVTNYLLTTNLYKDHYISMFNANHYHPMDENNNDNWCGGVDNMMLAMDYKGDFFPCLRYMESSLPEDREPIIIGNLEHGIYITEKEKRWENELANVTRKEQSTEECWHCPIAEGCAWCSAYNYEKFGTVRKRATFICPMHKAQALANAYYWNLVYIKENDARRFKINLPDTEALKFISQKELNMLHFLETFPTDIDITELFDIINQYPDMNINDVLMAYQEVKKEMSEQ